MEHGTHLRIQTTTQGIVDVSSLSESLLRESAIGDSIEKIPGDNFVILNKNGHKQKLLYIYIPEYLRNDPRWPREWKDRWYDEEYQK